MVWFPPTYLVVLDIIILIVSPARHESWEVELSCVLERIASVAGAPWKKEEGSIVKPRCAPYCWRSCDTEACDVEFCGQWDGMLRCITS
jgi:hypothetical protein